jgi:hypothetical protein
MRQPLLGTLTTDGDDLERHFARMVHDGSGCRRRVARRRVIRQCQHSQRQQGAVGEVQAEPSLDPLIARALEALQARFDGPVGNIEGSTWRYSGKSAEKDHCGASPRFGRGA